MNAGRIEGEQFIDVPEDSGLVIFATIDISSCLSNSRPVPMHLPCIYWNVSCPVPKSVRSIVTTEC